MRIHFLLTVVVAAFILVVPLSYAQSEVTKDPCEASINSAFTSLLASKNAELEAIFSSNVPTADLLDTSIDYLRDTYDEMDSICELLRTTPPSSESRSIPFNVALSRNIPGCADKNFDARQSIEYALYCDREKSEKLTALKDHARSFLMRDSMQEKATRLIEKYQETNLKLQGLSEDAVRFVQYIGKFNSAIGGVITKTCQQ